MQKPRNPERPHVQPGARSGWPRRALRWAAEAGNALIGPTEAAAQRQDVIRRAFVAGVIIATLPIQQLRIAGWPAVVGACGVALIYDLPLAYLTFVRKQYFVARILGLALDALLLMGASWYVLRELGAANSGSDIWLVFMVYVVTGGFTLAPLGSILYTGLWIGWFALATLLYFPSGSQYVEQLPIRLIFLGTVGLSALGMAGELDRRRARLAQQNRQTLGMLATLVEARDTDAGSHLYRIQHFSRALAIHIGLSEREAQEIAYASMVHDVGKANVPDAILKKTGPLNEEEWRIMQEHTAWGDLLLTDNSDFETARQVARWHHEHWDGGGYPDGLAGEAIPLAARVVAVADVYDALISRRPYKGPWPPEAAMQELRRLAGTHLDRSLVEAFCELWDSGVVLRLTKELADSSAHGHTAATERPA